MKKTIVILSMACFLTSAIIIPASRAASPENAVELAQDKVLGSATIDAKQANQKEATDDKAAIEKKNKADEERSETIKTITITIAVSIFWIVGTLLTHMIP